MSATISQASITCLALCKYVTLPLMPLIKEGWLFPFKHAEGLGTHQILTSNRSRSLSLCSAPKLPSSQKKITGWDCRPAEIYSLETWKQFSCETLQRDFPRRPPAWAGGVCRGTPPPAAEQRLTRSRRRLHRERLANQRDTETTRFFLASHP